jgi:hypothetical protein
VGVPRLKDLKGRVKRPVRSVRICLDGDLWARHDELTAKLDELGAKNIVRMGQTNDAAGVAQEIQDVEAAMREASVSIEIRGIGAYHFKEIQLRFPSEEENLAWDLDKGAPALLAACLVEPTTEDEAREFLEDVSDAVYKTIMGTCFLATTGSSEVPFSVRASELIRGSGSK